MILLGVVLGLLTLVFGLLNTKTVQYYARNLIIQELEQKLDTKIDIKRLYFRPFNTVGLDSLYVQDRESNEIMLIKNVSASVDLFELMKQNIVVSSARLSDFEIYLSKATADSTLNIQFIIDAFQSKDDKPKSQIDFKVSSLNIVNGNIRYDVLDKEHKTSGFDPNHIAIQDLDVKLALKSLRSDSLNIQIRKFDFKEQSGFEVTNLAGRLIKKDSLVSIKGFELLLPDSRIDFEKLELELPKTKSDTVPNHNHDTDDLKLDFVLGQSYISPKDIAAFVPQLVNFTDRVTLETEINGTGHDLKMDNLFLSFGDKLTVRANAEVIDWFDEGDTYIMASIDELTSSGKDIERLANSFSSKKVSLSQGIINQNNITFQGNLSGYLNQLTAFGTLDTDDGIIRTDVLFGFNKKEKVFSYAKGKIYTTGFELGDFLENDKLGHTSFQLSVDFDKPLYKELKGKVKGEIYDFDFKGYSYNNVNLDVEYKDKYVDGNLIIDDPNGMLSLDGLLDLTNKNYPELNLKAKVKDVQLDELQLMKNWEYSYLSLNLNANFIGSTIDNVQGYISVDSLEFYKNQEEFKLNELLVNASGLSANQDRKIEIKSDIVNGYIEGESSFASLANNLRYTLETYLSALYKEDKKKKVSPKNNDFRFHFDLNNTEALSSILKLPVTVYKPAIIDGFYNSKLDLLKVEATTPHINVGGMKIYSGHLLAENDEDNITASVKANIEGKNKVINNIQLSALVKDNSVATTITLENTSVDKAEGEFHLLAELERSDDDKYLRTKLNIGESRLLLNNKNWKMESSTVTIEPDLIDVNNFRFHTDDNEQALRINGKYSKNNPTNILKAELKDIDLEYVFETLAIDALKFGGQASGNIFVSTIEQKPYANTRLDVANFKFQGTELGHLDLFSELNEETNELILEGLLESKEKKKTNINGIIDPVNQNLSIHFDADSVDIGFLHAYAESIFDKVSGRGTGKIHLHGDFSNVTVEGVANIMDGKVGIKFLNTDYTFSDVVYLREGFIYFNDIAFYDQQGNIAITSGKVVHDYFQNIMYHIEMNASNFLLYNVTESQNPLFFGKVFGSGKGILSGDEQELNIEINMKTQKNTLVRMNLMEDEISEYSFITYKQPPDTLKEEGIIKSELLNPIKANSEMNINMNFYIDATPDATIELVMDPVGGDVLRGSGEGALQFVWSSKLAPELYGTFNVNRGNYNFTFQRIMERKFDIRQGSTVQFRGDPFEANLDVTAIYKVTASLSDLDKRIVDQSGQTTLPVNCVLNLTGPLKRPTVGLDIEFPTANADVARQIKSYMDTEDMMNRQVAYLLLLSKFHTSDIGEVDHPSSDIAVMASATLSSQLSKIISSVDSRLQLGTHIRMSDADFENSEKEMLLLLSSQLLNNRLLINGNFGYRDDPYINRDAVITDVDIEYLLNTSGTWRIKAYNHYNEKFYYLRDEGLQTQGVGIIYKKDFDKFSELFPFRRKRRLKQPTSYFFQPILPDSLRKGSELSDFIKIKKK